MSGRGGKNRSPILPVDQAALNAAFRRAVAMWGQDAFDLGIYKKIGRKQAASAQGLVENASSLKALVALSSGEILPGQLKEALLIYNASHNTSRYKAHIWAGSTATHFTTMLNHWRRLRTNENKKRQATMKTSRQVASQLEELLILESWSQACNRANPPIMILPKRLARKPLLPPMMKLPKSKRLAKHDGSEVEEVSLDDHGFPKMLQTPEMKRYMGPSPAKAATKASLPLKKSKPTSHMKELEAAAAAAAQALAEETAAKATKKTAQKVKQKPAASVQVKVQKKPAAAASAKRRLATEPGLCSWSKVRKVIASKQSYLQGMKDGKWILLISCTENMGASHPEGHAGVINALEAPAGEKGMTKARLLELRSAMVA